MITLATIPSRYHAALAAARVEVDFGARRWTLLDVVGGELAVLARVGQADAVTPDRLTLPATAHNTRALAVVLAEACGLDVSRGVLARLTVERLLWLEVNTITGGVDIARAGFAPRPWHALHRGCPDLATINPTDPGAIFRAIVAALCALETA